MSFVFDFEDSVLRNVRERGFDGVICGHIHAATIRSFEGVTYINCGDWVDSCTAIVEHVDGRMELVHWNLAAELAARDACANDPALPLSLPAPHTPELVAERDPA